MYSRYKIQMPAPPPDYAGTAFTQEPQPRFGELPSPEKSVPEENSGNTEVQPGGPAQEIRWEGPTDIVPEEPIDPGFTLPPEEEFPEEIPEKESSAESGPEPDVELSPPQSESNPASGEDDSAGSLLAGMNPDDLLFIGAMLYLLSGKPGDDSFLLLAYLLTCGL